MLSVDTCMIHKVNDIKHSELYKNLPFRNRYTRKEDICSNINFYYKDLLGIHSLENLITNPLLLPGIEKYNLIKVYPNNLYMTKDKYDEDLTYLISFLDGFWRLIKDADGNNDRLKEKLALLPFYQVLMYYITYHMYTDTLNDALLDEDMSIELDSTDDINNYDDIIGYIMSKGIDTINSILRKYNFVRRISDLSDLDDNDTPEVDMSIFYDDDYEDIGVNPTFFQIDNLIIDGINFKDGIRLASLSNRLSTKLDEIYYDNDTDRVDTIMSKYDFGTSRYLLVKRYDHIYRLSYKIVPLLRLAQLTNKHLSDYLINV
jgi:hypothetical protein